MKKRVLSISLTLAMLIGLLCFPAQAAEGSYSDTSGHWAEAAIARWSGYGVIEGNHGFFRPDDALTRAELSAILDRVMGYQEQAENTFSDLGDAWYTGAMLRLNAAGVLEGSNGRAMPDGTVSRQEAAVLLGRALQLEESGKALSFTDAASVASWADGYVSAMAEAGYIQGYQGAFAPGDSVTRASLVTMLDNMVSGFVNVDGDYSADAAHDLVVNASNVTLKDMTVGGDLIIADGVGGGDVYLDNVKVEGKVVLRGCGENSFHVLPGTDLSGSAVIICKTASGGIRLVNESGAPIPMVNVADGKDGVTLTGEFGSVVIASDAPVALKDATVTEAVSVTAAGADLSVTGKSQVARLDVAETATGSSLKMDKGTVDTLSVAADGLTVDGEAAHTTVSDSVKEQPQTPGGKPANGGSTNGGGSSGGGGGGNSGGNDTPTVVTLTSVAANLASPQAGKTATDAVPAGVGYTVSTAWSPALVDGKFAVGTAYTATLTFTPAANYQWAAEAPTVTVNNSTSYGGAPTVGAPVLAEGKVTVTASYPATGSGLAIVVDGQPESSLTLIAGRYSRRLYTSAHVEDSGEKLPNYLVSYQWYTAEAADKTGAAPIVNAADATYELPSGLTVGTYYYFCRMTADGCGTMDSTVTTVNIIESSGEDVLLTNLRLTQDILLSDGSSMNSPGSLYLTWDYSGNATAEQFYLACYSENDKVAATNWHVDRSNINLQYTLADNTYMHPTCTINNIEFTPVTRDPDAHQNVPLGPTAKLDCQITTASHEVPTGVSATLDRSTGMFTVTGLPTDGGYTHVTTICQTSTNPYAGAWGGSLFDSNFSDGEFTQNLSKNVELQYLKESGAMVRILLYTSTISDSDSSQAHMDIAYTQLLPVVLLDSDN